MKSTEIKVDINRVFNQKHVEDYLLGEIKNRNTRMTYKRAISMFFLYSRDDRELNSDYMIRYTCYLSTHYSLKSVRQHLSAINSYLLYYTTKYKISTPFFELPKNTKNIVHQKNMGKHIKKRRTARAYAV